MAMADYLWCAGCGGKLIYDADWYERSNGLVLEGLCRECQAAGTKILILRADGTKAEAAPRDYD